MFQQNRARKRINESNIKKAAANALGNAKKKRQEELNQSTSSSASAVSGKSTPVLVHDDFVVTANDETSAQESVCELPILQSVRSVYLRRCLQEADSDSDEEADAVIMDDNVDNWRQRRKGKTPLVGAKRTETNVKSEESEQQEAEATDNVATSTEAASTGVERLPGVIEQPAPVPPAQRNKPAKKRAKGPTQSSTSAESSTAGGDSSNSEVESLRSEVKGLKNSLKSLRTDVLEIMKMLIPGLPVIHDLEHVDGVVAEMIRVNDGARNNAAADRPSSTTQPQSADVCDSDSDVEITHVEEARGRAFKKESDMKEEVRVEAAASVQDCDSGSV